MRTAPYYVSTLQLFFALLFCLLSLTRLAFSQEEQKEQALDPEKERYRSTLLFANILELIRDEYVDSEDIDYQFLTQSALKGMLSSLDPYSEFLDGEKFQDLRTETEGEFGGLGIYVGMKKDGSVVINATTENGPGKRSGLLPNDMILSINNVSTENLTLGDVIHKLRGPSGEPVVLKIGRSSIEEEVEISVVREIINVPTVLNTRILSSPSETDPLKLGYIFISQFGEKTENEFETALETLKEEKIQGLVLDLRNNPGGLLDSAVQVAGKFTPKGTIIAFTETRFEERKLFKAQGNTHYDKLPLILLINRNSASGAEIVAGALQDLGRALLIGERSFGKGSVQSIQPVDISIDPPVGIRLTTAKYYTPSKKVIHKVGITPDIEVNITRDNSDTIFLQQTAYRLPPNEKDKLLSIPDPQLDRAVAILKGLIYYYRLYAPSNSS
ncbi:MAG: S41 family peptidase [Verrucomicrobiota bacterium]